LLVLASGESDAEHADEVAIDGLALNERLNESVPLLDQSAELVSGDIHAMEVSVAVVALDFFDLHLHLSPGVLVGLSVQVTQRYLENTTSQAVSGVLLTSGLVARSQSGYSVVENTRNVHVVPFLLNERMDTIKETHRKVRSQPRQRI